MLNEFLTVYQTDSPMIPFLYSDLTTLITELMRKIVKDDLIVGKSVASISEIDVEDQKSLKSPAVIDLGYAVSEEIRKNRENLSKEILLKFRKMALKFLTAMIKKLRERCPLRYPMVKGATCLDPKMLTTSRHTMTQTGIFLAKKAFF